MVNDKIMKYISYIINGYYMKLIDGRSTLQIRLFTIFSITFLWSLKEKKVIVFGIAIRFWRFECSNSFMYWFEKLQDIM